MKEQHVAGATDFRLDLTRHLTSAEHHDRPVVVTRHGRPVAALVPYQLIEQILAHLETLPRDDAPWAEAIRRAFPKPSGVRA